MRAFFLVLLLGLAGLSGAHAGSSETPEPGAQPKPVEVHDVLRAAQDARQIALTLDACSGHYDAALIDFLIERRIPATLFVTERWLARNPAAVQVLKAHLDLFDVENHGEKHRAAVLGEGRTVYGVAGVPDLVHLRREVVEGARAVKAYVGVTPHWYRAATAMYDAEAIEEIQRLGYGIAGFSVSADQGATLHQAEIEKRLARVKPGDVLIAHMNKPDSDTAEGLSVGLARLLDQGFVFVRFDQVALRRTR